MPQLFTNNARALLASGITDSATAMTVEASKADLFPTANVGSGSVPSTNNWFKVTLQDAAGNVEIVYVRTRTAGSGVMSNLLRGQEGTTARAFSAGTVVGLRITAADVEGSIAAAANSVQLSGNQTIGGVKTFSEPIVGSTTTQVSLTGNQTIGGVKTFTGNVTAAAFIGDGSQLTGITVVPAGAVMHFAMNSPPTGWLRANGAAVSRTTFGALFAAIGTTYGAGDGSTTFNLPDLRGEFLRGWDDGRGVDSGRVFGSGQGDAFQNHGHQMQFSSAGPVDSWTVDGNAGTSFGRGANGGGSGYGSMNIRGPKEEGGNGTPRTAAETRPRNIALLACIKF